ncbi:MAG: hypothetical protein A2504_09235 [Bdellovibrionales bacterium RIFOXYD12_FULL_39_22]|nr:MAG: hypothetical protein A2385_17315 [Bdellovibrionales bacterium RIFOXYB1_FULL_39_21]OFZ41075.1 MAG: hypothetical protein A2485_00240 [Bdellovibrionales bacterium RIFOXYC12_FULL_39_17]OFZ50288.1 MAG: hypothetical protein A2404_07555 [Bdellovibrionales bacterium RIFOXYC1_FULL_39_130]OFZ75089.1 MAG: hypothetical protein A2560_16250 [Bdellovibrionales bacterium RIFOXYD1_FULL_39_84]OFZ92269.1 MAG: hypothetical protein A2504_09235 [Bdellovibrionales bacterium RIFOXYD12_FULL_39_22]HLE10929.1 re
MRILFIDDDDSVRQLYTMLLDNLVDNVEIIPAISGNQAIKILKEDANFDLLLCDYRMEDGNGDIVYQYIKKNLPKTPFVLFTTEDINNLEVFKNFFRDNVLNCFIQKPVKPAKFKLDMAGLISRISSGYILESNTAFKKIRYIYFLRFNKVLCDIYIKLSKDKFVKFINSGDEYSKENIKRYLRPGEQFLYITESDYNSFSTTFAQTPFLIQSDNYNNKQIENTVTSTIEIVHELIRTVGVGSTVVSLVDSCVSKINSDNSNDPDRLDGLLKKVRNRQDYINDHSFLVAYIGSAISKKMGLGSDVMFEKVTYAALLHDGLLDDPQFAWEADTSHPALVNFSEAQLKILHSHPLETAKIISDSHRFPKDVELIVAQHHENPEGTGFPRQLSAVKISPMVAIFLVAHAFVNEIYKVDFNTAKYRAIIKQMNKRFSKGNYKQPMSALSDLYI